MAGGVVRQAGVNLETADCIASRKRGRCFSGTGKLTRKG